MNRQMLAGVGALIVVAIALWLWPTAASRKTERAPANTEQAHPPAELEATPKGPRDAGTIAEPGPSEPELLPLDCDAPSGDVVTIDQAGISAADFCARLTQIAGPRSSGDPNVMERQGRALLEHMIDAFLVDRALSQAGQRVSEKEIDAELERAWRPLDSEHKQKMRDALDEQIKSGSPEVKAMRDDLRQRAGLNKLIALRGTLEPTEAEIADAYNADPTRFGAPRRATVEGFIARAAPSAPAHARAKAKGAAEALANALHGGSGDPAALAGEHGLTPVAPFDVDGSGPEPELVAIAFTLPIGAWSSAIPTQAGFTVLKVLKKNEGEARPLAEVREQVVNVVKARRELGEQKRILADLRAQAAIVHKQW